MISATDLSKRYRDGHLALDALNIEVQAGQLYCLLGAQSSGKTTAVHLLLGLTEPTSGRAEIAGFDLRTNARQARQATCYLPPDFAFYESLTGRENLRMFARLGGRKGFTRHDENLALREVGLAERAFDQLMTSYSRGMRQKLAVAVALLRDAPVWILDEPFVGLDPQTSAELVELLQGARERNKTLLWATQNLFQAKQLADSVGILKEGRQVLSYTREELGYQDLEQLYLNYMRGGSQASGSMSSSVS